MEITEFCKHADAVIKQHPFVVIVSGKQYSPLLFDKFLKFWQTKITTTAQKLDVDQDLAQLQVKLSTTFLGQSFLFWFGDLLLLSSKKKRSDFLNFLQSYQGPHQIIGWIDEQDLGQFRSDAACIIQVQETYEKDKAAKLSFLYAQVKPEVAAYFLERLYRIQKEYTLEQLCLLESYVGLVGKNLDLFFETWLPQLIMADVSLFYLAQLFFQKRANLFFDCWQQVRGYYPDQFWIVFFSDHLFKAYFYVAVQGRVAAEQKQMTYGLPFSFLKQDWKFFKTESLQQAHAWLYDVDYDLKNGGNPGALDLFFMKFFA